MARPPEDTLKPDDLPVLTELSDTGTKIPVLTEAVAQEMQRAAVLRNAPLTDADYRDLAAELAPVLENMLREKFASQFEALWQESWRQVEENLPELIRDKLTTRPRRSPK